MRLIELGVPRSERDRPDARHKAQLPDFVRQPFHAVRKLLLERPQVEVREIAYGQLRAVVLPRFDVPDLETERLELFRGHARFGQVLGLAGCIEVHVPRHPARRRSGATFPVQRREPRRPPLAVIAAHHFEGRRGLPRNVNGRAPDHIKPVLRCADARAAGLKPQQRVVYAVVHGIVERAVRAARGELHHSRGLRRPRAARKAVSAQPGCALNDEMSLEILARPMHRRDLDTVARTGKHDITLDVMVRRLHRQPGPETVARGHHPPRVRLALLEDFETERSRD